MLLLATLAAASAAAALTPTTASAIAWGVDGPTGDNINYEPIFKVMKARGLTEFRIGVDLRHNAMPSTPVKLRHAVELARRYGVHLKPIFGFPLAWGDRTDGGAFPQGDRDGLYKQAHDAVYAIVSQFGGDMKDWELGNELNLLARDGQGQRFFGRGQTAQEFEQPVMEDWAAVLHGASDAIDEVSREHHEHLRRVLNTTSTMFGFLDFMQSRGVKYEVISYHYYEKFGQDPHRAWAGSSPRFDLFDKLASYKRPVTFNEVNCGEIYLPNYENAAGGPLTERCYRNLDAILTSLVQQKQVDIESVLLYELFDEPAKAPPENRFGLMYDVNRPKVPLFLLTKFAGGPLTSAEQAELTRRGF